MLGPKTKAIRSEALRNAYRLIPCQWEGCGRSDGTVCCAHSNFAGYGGKGMGRKADDTYGASLCHRHHMELDQGKDMSYEERREGWIAAHHRTMDELIRRSWDDWRLRHLLERYGIVK